MQLNIESGLKKAHRQPKKLCLYLERTEDTEAALPKLNHYNLHVLLACNHTISMFVHNEVRGPAHAWRQCLSLQLSAYHVEWMCVSIRFKVWNRKVLSWNGCRVWTSEGPQASLRSVCVRVRARADVRACVRVCARARAHTHVCSMAMFIHR